MPATDQRATADIQSVLEADDRRLAACMTGDIATLEQLLTEDFTYIHSTGFREGREPFLARISSGQVRYLELSRPQATVRVNGDVAIVDGSSFMRYQLPSQSTSSTLETLYLAVWTRSGGGWQLAAYASTEHPATA